VIEVTSHTFTATVLKPDDGPGHAVALPFDAVEVFGRARAPVVVTVPGHEPFRTTIASYGGTGWIGLRKAQRDDLMVGEGDEITMTVELDDVPRVAKVPPELAAALASNQDAAIAFEGLSYSHTREYAEWVDGAKRPTTRERRAAEAVQRILKAASARSSSRGSRGSAATTGVDPSGPTAR
jgi:Bacteriocin-protection, YdeI or OmpD-Associated/Domain of unknown function (DUF1905)